MATLLKNNTKGAFNLPGGVTLGPGEKATVPEWVLSEPYTQARMRNGRLEVVVESKGGKGKRKAVQVEAVDPDEKSE